MSEQQQTLPRGPLPAAEADPAAEAVRAPGVLAHLRYVLRSMRPRQWSKNGIVYLAFIFAIGEEWKIDDPSSWLPLLGWTTVAFGLFCLISSADYLVNDIVDRESDRLHPRKRKRPIAAGQLSVRAAWTWAVVLAATSLTIGFALTPALTWHIGAVLAGYLALMIAYTFVLKHIVLMDMTAIAAGFVLRAIAGAIAIEAPISPWLYLVTALGALFMVIHKRRAELTLLESGAANHRPILQEYSKDLLDQMASLVTSSTLIAYGLYTFTADNLPDNNAMMLTIPFVLYGLFRYLYLVHQKAAGGSPEEIFLSDWPLIIDMVLWLVTAGTVLVVYRD